ncbi:MAG: DUF3108 domain-containing protein [Hydrogenophilales bacterium]|nr:DUF3108 domain-containing protein [Hydrogenophilales bacterium]
MRQTLITGIFRGTIALLLAGIFTPALAAPAQSTFTYSINQGKEVIGEIQETLTIDAQRYKLESKTTPLGVAAIFVKDTILMRSEGGYGAGGFQPERFEYHRSTKPKKDATARFDWAAKTAEFSFEGKTESQALPELLQDRLSALYQFRFLPKPPKTQTLPVSNGKKIENQLFKYGGEEMLTLPIGKVKAMRYVRERTPDDDGIALWISEQWAAPVKIVVTSKKGNQTEQVLKRAKLDGR